MEKDLKKDGTCKDESLDELFTEKLKEILKKDDLDAKDLEILNGVKKDLTHEEEKWYKKHFDTLFAGGINILGIILVLGYEKFNIITSRAFGLIKRGRV